MSFVPQPCASDDCCPDHLTGFCLEDGTPIALVILEGELLGWIDLNTGIFTPGPPPPGIVECFSDADTEDNILCDVDQNGNVLATVLVARTYDELGVPGPPSFFDPETGNPYVVQGSLQHCPADVAISGITFDVADTEEQIFCDIDANGDVIAPVLVARTYDENGVPGPPQFLDPFTSAPYVVQGTLDICPEATGRFLTCETDSITVCVSGVVPVTGTIADTEEQILCDVDECGVTLATVLVTRTYDANGNPGPPKFYDLLTGLPYVVQGTLQVCDQRVQICDPVTVCPGSEPIPVDVKLDCDVDSVTVCPGDDPLIVAVTGVVEVVNPPSGFSIDNSTPLDVDIVNNQLEVIPGRRSLLGMYYVTVGPQAYTTAADSATGGDFWLLNTSGSAVLYVREVRFTVVIDDLSILTSLPTVRMERMTFTGTPSSAIITPARRDSTDAANVGTFRTGTSGLTPSPGAPIRSFAPASSDVIGGLLSANAGVGVPVEQVLAPIDIDGFIAVRQNEGIVFRQHTVGSTPENRQYWLNITWEEV